MEQVFKDKFGRLLSWADFMPLMRACVYKRFGQGLDSHDVDDALSMVYLDMLEHWIHYAGSTNEDGTLNLGYAIQNGLKRFGRFYGRPDYFPEDVQNSVHPAYDAQEVEFLGWLEIQDQNEVDGWLGAVTGSTVEGVSDRTNRRYRANRKRQMKRAWDARRGA